MPCAYAVAEAQQLAPDVFAETSQLQQPGREQQQVQSWSNLRGQQSHIDCCSACQLSHLSACRSTWL